jgi:hypothetical protein
MHNKVKKFTNSFNFIHSFHSFIHSKIKIHIPYRKKCFSSFQGRSLIVLSLPEKRNKKR